MVGTTGFEPATPCPPDMCATRLRYVPPSDLFIILNLVHTRCNNQIELNYKLTLTELDASMAICLADSIDSDLATTTPMRR